MSCNPTMTWLPYQRRNQKRGAIKRTSGMVLLPIFLEIACKARIQLLNIKMFYFEQKLSTNMNLTFISNAPQTSKGSIPGSLWFGSFRTWFGSFRTDIENGWDQLVRGLQGVAIYRVHALYNLLHNGDRNLHFTDGTSIRINQRETSFFVSTLQ